MKLHTDLGSFRAVAQCGDVARIRVAITRAKHHAADFTALVPWPALAASFDADVVMLERALRDLQRAAVEPVA